MTRKFYLGKSQAHYTLVDEEDFDWLNQWKWGYSEGYAYRTIMVLGRKQKIWMHREIMQTPDGYDTDHINLDRLDNRKENLRICTRSQNQANRNKMPNNTSGYRGVSKRGHSWKARIQVNKVGINLGDFRNIIDAAKAYDLAAIEYFGEYAKTNFS